MERRKPTLAEIKAANPRQPGENLFAYSQRLGQLQWQAATPAGPLAVADNVPQIIPDVLEATARGMKGVFDWGAGYGQKFAETTQDAGAAYRAFSQDAGANTRQFLDKALTTRAEARAAPKPATPRPEVALRQLDQYDQMVEQLWGRLERQESGGNQAAVSKKGAIGVAQVMPGTAPEAAKLAGLPWDEQRYRTDANYNRALGKAYLKQQLKTFGSPELALAAYNAGPGAVRKYGGVPPFAETQDYVSRIMGTVKEYGGINIPYDPSYIQKAMGEVNAAGEAAMRPETFTYTPPPAPEMPEAQPIPLTDFSKVDAALEKLKPQEMLEKDKLRLRRSEWLAGIGQALASLPDGAGLGKVLAAVGGGALMGAARGDEEVRARQDKFDEQMVRYQTAIANNEMQKAQTLQNEMQHNVEMSNRTALQKFQLAYDRWSKENFATVGADGTVITSKAGADGQVTIQRTPSKAAIMARTALARADLYQALGQGVNAASQQEAQMRNSLLVSAAGQSAMIAMQDERAAKAAGATNPTDGIALGMATVVGDLVATGRAGSIFSSVGQEDMFEELQEQIQKDVIGMGVIPGSKEYAEAYQNVMSERLLSYALQDQKFGKTVLGMAGASTALRSAQEMRETKRTVRSGPKGTTTTQEYRRGE